MVLGVWRGILVIAFAAPSLVAQTVPGAAAIRGDVLDEQGLPVARARILLTENAKGLVWKSESSAYGEFLFPSLSAGVYTLEALKEGFATRRVDGITVEVGQRAVLAVRLEIGAIRTVLTVSADDVVSLDVESNVLGTVVDSERVSQLPLNGRNFLQLALLSGGAVELSAANDMMSANVGRPGRAVVPPGSFPYSVSYMIDGISVRGARDGELALDLSTAAIDQFKVQESFFLPDQGPNISAVNIVSKSGSNRFHGEVFEFLRNRNFDARSFFAAQPEDLKRNQFGFALGGPLRRDRVWFHGFYQGLREITAFSQAGYSPTAAMFGGDFSETGIPIYDPASFDLAAGTRAPFPRNIIPSDRLNPVAANLKKYDLPGSSLGSLPSNVSGTPRNTLDDNQGGLRLDASWTPKHHLYISALRESSPAVQRGLFPLSGLLFSNSADLVMADHTWSATPALVNTLRIGFVRAVAIGGNEARNLGPLLKSIGILNTFDDRGVGAVGVLGFSSFGRSNGDVGNSDNTWQIDEGLHYARANHTFSFGAGFRYRRGWHLNSNRLALGELQFQPTFTAQLVRNAQGQLTPQGSAGSSWADFLLGLPTSTQLSGIPVTPYRGTQLFPYAQDTWNLTPNLTLNYGVSWHLDTPPGPQGPMRNQVHGFDRATGLLTYAALGQLVPRVMATDRNNVAPRAGLAWRPALLKNTVVRAGAGIYYSEFPWFLAQYSLNVSPPFGAGQGFAVSPTNPAPAYELGRNVYLPVASQPLTTDYAANLPPGTVASSIDPGVRTGYAAQWNLSLQHGVGKTDFMEVSYLGASAHRLPNLTDLSRCRPGADLYCDPATKAWPRYNLLLWLDSGGNSSYQALIAKYHHRAARELSLRFEYTLAKALADAWQGSLNPIGQIPTCRRCDKGPATFDVRQRAVASWVWNIPFGRGRKYGRNMSSIPNRIAGGWSLTGIATFATGQPVYLTGPNRTASLFLGNLPNRICDGRSGALSGNLRNNGFLWFDTACFPVPTVGYFGNSGRTAIGGPGLNNWDVGIEKSISLSPKEGASLLVRAEFFNAWNHTQFQQPNGNAGGGAIFGRISAARAPRLIQLAMKFAW